MKQKIWLQAYVGDIANSVPVYHNKAKLQERKSQIFVCLFPSAYKSYIGIIL